MVSIMNENEPRLPASAIIPAFRKPAVAFPAPLLTLPERPPVIATGWSVALATVPVVLV